MSAERESGIADVDLHAYVDDFLPQERRLEVEAWLATRPEEAERVRAWQRQNEGLRRLLRGVLEEPVPAHLSARPRPRSIVPVAAAAAALLLVGAGLGWVARGGSSAAIRPAFAQSLPRLAAIAHAVYSPEVRHPVEVGAGEEAHLVAWLSKRLGVQLRPPDLRDLRYQLMGGRLLPGSRGPVAQFMYADPNGTRLTLYLTADAGGGGETAFRFAQEGQVSVFYWVDRRMGYALSGQMSRPDLLRVAEVVYSQLER